MGKTNQFEAVRIFIKWAVAAGNDGNAQIMENHVRAAFEVMEDCKALATQILFAHILAHVKNSEFAEARRKLVTYKQTLDDVALMLGRRTET